MKKNKTKQESQTGLNRLPENQNQQHTFVYVSALNVIILSKINLQLYLLA